MEKVFVQCLKRLVLAGVLNQGGISTRRPENANDLYLEDVMGHATDSRGRQNVKKHVRIGEENKDKNDTKKKSRKIFPCNNNFNNSNIC